MRHIAGDALEYSRIRLERDLENIPFSPSMSLENPASADEDISSVDFPRHNSRQNFQSFEQVSHLDSDFYSRHGEGDSIALDPELGYTMSTAAHHASALTLSAGLRGRNAYGHPSSRGSPSGAEYDPDRPLQAILDKRVADGLSLFDATSHSKSRNKTRTTPSFDPVVVDSTAELDRYLLTGHERPTHLVYPYQSRSHSQPSSDGSRSDSLHSRLTHALGSNFSPKRPRSAPVTVTDQSSRNKKSATSSHLNPSVHYAKPERTTANQLPTRSGPTSDGLKDSAAKARLPRSGASGTASRPPFSELSNKHARVVLPDVTGLTSAVQSPTKKEVAYPDVLTPSPRVPDLLPALDALQMRLQALERANSISRRRVRELEHELEDCRAEVLVERTRIEEQMFDKAHAKVRNHHAAAVSRYRTVIAEKKSLEALLATLRSHLARLTMELSTHKDVIESLRSRVGHDTRGEVQALRLEVERLAGEVERLKAVVEEGLRERRRSKQESGDENEVADAPGFAEEQPAQADTHLTYLSVPAPEMSSSKMKMLKTDNKQLGPEQDEQKLSHQEEDVHAQGSIFHPEYHGHEESHAHDSRLVDEYHEGVFQDEQDDRSASEPQPVLDSGQRYIHVSELARIENEVRERRSEDSRRNVSPEIFEDNSGNASFLHEAEPQVRPVRRSPERQRVPNAEVKRESVVPSSLLNVPQPAVPPAPFPQIRGSRMERLFFSAPEHNVRTCIACRRKRRPEPSYKPGAGNDNDVNVDGDFVHTYLRTRAHRSKHAVGCDDDDDNRNKLPPQTVLARVVRELEDDFSHYKAMYLELAEQYGAMDAASNVAKRNVLADHLRDVIDILEQKGDQIASLYELLNFKDKRITQMPRAREQNTAFG